MLARRVAAATFGALVGTYLVALHVAPKIAAPVRPPEPKDNAFPLLVAATAKTYRDNDVSDAVAKMPKRVWTPEEKQAMIAQNQTVLAQTRAALCDPYYALDANNAFYDATPHYAQFRQTVRLFALAGNVAWEAGHQQEAVAYYADEITMGRRIPNRVGLVGSLVGISCETIGRRAMWDHLDAMNADAATLALARLEALRRERLPYRETLREEKFSLCSGVNRMLEHPQLFTKVFGSDVHPAIRIYSRVVPRKFIVDTLGTQMDKVIAQSQKPYVLDHEELPLPNEIMTRIMIPVMSVARCKHVASETADNLLRAALALRIYHLEHGAYPKTLDDLVDAKLMTEVPEDLFALPGTRLEYRLQPDRKYLLYSIGPDGRNDNGKGIDNNANYPGASSNPAVSQDSKGDMVAGWYAY